MTINNRWLLLIALTIILFIINIDYTAVNLALIPIAADLNANLNNVQWILSAYVLAWAVLVIPAGKLADRYSKKTLCLIGLTLFLFASLLAGVAVSSNYLITARILQGVAGAIYIPTVYALIYLNFKENERGKAMGLLSLGVGLGMAIGPFIGGVLLSWMNWRSIFLINLPIGIPALLIILAQSNIETVTKQIPSINKTRSLFPLNLFSNSLFLGCCVGILLEQYCFSAIMVSTGLFLQKVLLFSSLQSSFSFLWLTILFGIIAAFSGSWIDKIGLRWPTTIGLLVMVLGLILFTNLSLINHLVMTYFVFMILGAGMGVAFVALNTGIVKTVAQSEIGIASSIFLMCALVGNALGVTLTSMIYQTASFAKLLHSLALKQVVLAQHQLQQLQQLITNIGEQSYSLSDASQNLQTIIANEIANALAHGINKVMLVTSVICLFSAICCAYLFKRNVRNAL